MPRAPDASRQRATAWIGTHGAPTPTIRLNATETQRFLARLDAPAGPNHALTRAMARFRIARIGPSDAAFDGVPRSTRG
ncbi:MULTISPECIES: DUF1778 domain-containing protein [Cupriavidus]|jgi:uncharacterized protein (DUF1778 family)|uniref:DUF1778 domain-containing protein n=1 Tax=Cupriavidus campinensis TaxID=151783 RepID=A0ABY3EMB2_9BURK|nr:MULTISPECIES: DUF1778 domain-containing protein [Cupriavidus]MWL89993.1 DUF1778 domain-containing protein [Cupriavidus sp. SW-Y-13]QWE96797.1 DUF1778 domain-containing protein [Cupriavidus sp. EM10]TSP12051.1 DUF1778 domain-containing protein [Cupriavidus campinensis]